LQQFYATVKKIYCEDKTPIAPCIKTPDDERLLSCTAIQNGITITPDGTVIACSAIPLPLGNIVNDSIESILFSEQADAIIKALQVSSTPGCASCEDKFGCIRCPGIAYMDNLSMNTTPLEACRHTKAFKSISDNQNYNQVL
jgi:AdoMet-dependent heme synthase